MVCPCQLRVDLICALPETYWTTVVGWTGGTMFQRDLRLVAKSVYVRSYLNPVQTRANFSIFLHSGSIGLDCMFNFTACIKGY